MKFLFIVQGEGRGHMTQSVSMHDLLIANGHEVVGVLVGKSERRIIPDFFHKRISVPVQTYESPNFVVDNNNKGIKLFSTVVYNLKKYPVYFNSLRFLKNEINRLKPDVIINFYELLCGIHYFLKKPSIPCISIGHQFLLFHPEFVFPKGKRTDRFLLNMTSKITSYNSIKRLALSFYKTSDYLKKRVYVVPPILRKEILELKPLKKDYILSYILNDGYREEITKWHENNKNIEVHLFGDGKFDKDEVEIHENLIWHKINDVKFMNYMKDCSGFASTAGFESVCEAMYLKKPIMMVPTGGHFEQECNSIDASRAGAGIVNTRFDLSKLVEFIPSYNSSDTTFQNWVKSSSELFIYHLTNPYSK